MLKGLNSKIVYNFKHLPLLRFEMYTQTHHPINFVVIQVIWVANHHTIFVCGTCPAHCRGGVHLQSTMSELWARFLLCPSDWPSSLVTCQSNVGADSAVAWPECVLWMWCWIRHLELDEGWMTRYHESTPSISWPSTIEGQESVYTL